MDSFKKYFWKAYKVTKSRFWQYFHLNIKKFSILFSGAIIGVVLFVLLGGLFKMKIFWLSFLVDLLFIYRLLYIILTDITIKDFYKHIHNHWIKDKKIYYYITFPADIIYSASSYYINMIIYYPETKKIKILSEYLLTETMFQCCYCVSKREEKKYKLEVIKLKGLLLAHKVNFNQTDKILTWC